MRSKKLTTVAFETLGDSAIQVETTLPVRPRRHESRKGGRLDATFDAPGRSRTPRITRLMALAIKFQDMVDRGEVRDYADLARLGYVTRARLTQIMNLMLLAPDIQSEVLGMDRASAKKTEVSEKAMRALVQCALWQQQRCLWAQITTEPIAAESQTG